MLEVEGLEIVVPGFRLGPLSLDVADGEYFVLLGPSGSGKTMLLEWMAGFHRAKRGSLRVDGVESAALPPQERGLAIVYQDAALFPHMSVADNLAYAPRVRGWAPERIEARVDELADLLRLRHRLDARPAHLSGGEARRVGLGRALAAGQRTLLLDEPLTGLEPGLQRDLRNEIAQLHRDLGLTVFHITHDFDEARSLADRVGVLVEGKLVQVGLLEEVSRHPATDAVARFVSA